MARTSRPRDPLAGKDRLLVDANNLLGALDRERSLPPAALIGRIRAAIPASVAIELVFDGPPSGGPGRRLTAGVTVRYSGGRTADALLRTMVEAAGPLAPGYEPTTLVVTDDAELRRLLRGGGAATAGTAWLLRRLDRTRLSGPAVGARRPPGPQTPTTTDDDEAGRWRPGRGATRKTGNPRRSPKGHRGGPARRPGDSRPPGSRRPPGNEPGC
jgi:hypothetical protein